MANELGYINQYDLLHSQGDLWKMSAIAAMRLADNILNESPYTDHHESRMMWAGSILQNADEWVNNNKWKIIQNPTILSSGHSSTDTDVEYVISCLVPV